MENGPIIMLTAHHTNSHHPPVRRWETVQGNGRSFHTPTPSSSDWDIMYIHTLLVPLHSFQLLNAISLAVNQKGGREGPKGGRLGKDRGWPMRTQCYNNSLSLPDLLIESRSNWPIESLRKKWLFLLSDFCRQCVYCSVSQNGPIRTCRATSSSFPEVPNQSDVSTCHANENKRRHQYPPPVISAAGTIIFRKWRSKFIGRQRPTLLRLIR